MLTYIGIGVGLAIIRLLFEEKQRRETSWIWAVAMTDVLWWPLVLIVQVLHFGKASCGELK